MRRSTKTRPALGLAATVLGTAATGIALAATPVSAATIARVSLGTGGVQSNGHSQSPALSANGRFVAFVSNATNLVPGDTNGDFDVFVRDRLARATTRVSVGPGGRQGDDRSASGGISADGRFVAFESDASNLVPGDTNEEGDVFVRDFRSGTTERVSIGTGGAQGNRQSEGPAISDDGRLVAFHSFATNLVPGDTNGLGDLFLRDRVAGTTTRINVGPGGVQADFDPFLTRSEPVFSANGRFVAFMSNATNLVPGDTNGVEDVFLRDLRRGVTLRVSLGAGFAQADGDSFRPAISANGRVVGFGSSATDLVPGDTNGESDVFVRVR